MSWEKSAILYSVQRTDCVVQKISHLLGSVTNLPPYENKNKYNQSQYNGLSIVSRLLWRMLRHVKTTSCKTISLIKVDRKD